MGFDLNVVFLQIGILKPELVRVPKLRQCHPLALIKGIQKYTGICCSNFSLGQPSPDSSCGKN